MTDLLEQLRSYGERLDRAVAEVTAEDVMVRSLEPAMVAHATGRPWRPRLVVGSVAAAAVALVAGFAWWATSRGDDVVVVDGGALARLDDLTVDDIASFTAVIELRDLRDTVEVGGSVRIEHDAGSGATRLEVVAGDGELVQPGEVVAWVDGAAYLLTAEGPETAVASPEPIVRPLSWPAHFADRCDRSDLVPHGTTTVVGRDAIHVSCSTVREDWEAWVDEATGLVLRARGRVPLADEGIGGVDDGLIEVRTFEQLSDGDAADLTARVRALVAEALDVVPSAALDRLPPMRAVVSATLFAEVVAAETGAELGETAVAGGEEAAGDLVTVSELRFVDGSTWRIDLLESDERTGRVAGSYEVQAGAMLGEYDAGSNTWNVTPLSEMIRELVEPGVPSPIDPFVRIGIDHADERLVRDDVRCAVAEEARWRGRPARLQPLCELADLDPVAAAAATARGLPLTVSYVVDEATGLVVRVEAPWGRLEVVDFDPDPTFDDDDFDLVAPPGAHDVSLGSAPRAEQPPSPLVGSPAPPLPAATHSGGTYDPEQLRASRVVVVVWASWCPPCLDVLEEAQDVAAGLPDGVEVVTVASQDQPAAVAEIVERGALTVPVLADPDGAYLRSLEATGIPVTVLIDEAGDVLAVHVGRFDGGLAARIAELG